MKKIKLPVLFVLSLAFCAHGQGTFILANYTAPTRLYSADGALAGPDIWGQAVGGSNIDSMSPLGTAIDHGMTGVLSFFPTIYVQGGQIGDDFFAQMVAWDGTLWGTDLANVPFNQRGYTDVVQVTLVSPTGNQDITLFTQPAVVPIVPEPTASTFIIIGVLCASFCHGREKRSCLNRGVNSFISLFRKKDQS